MTIAWKPDPETAKSTNVARLMKRHDLASASDLRERSAAEPEWFWPAAVEDLGIEFDTPWQTLLDTSKGHAHAAWFVGGKLNLVKNCLGRHAASDHADEVCLVTLNETGEEISYTFRTLQAEVNRCAAAMNRLGVKRGDRVAAYMPMIGEVVVQMLATIQMGAIFIPIFSGYAPGALAERLNGAEVKLLFTADVSSRKGKPVEVLAPAREALEDCPSVAHTVIVTRSAGNDIDLIEGRDISWNEFLASGRGPAPCPSMDAMDPAIILFTSGTTGRPKGTVHSHAGTLVQIAKEVGYAFDMKPDDRFFWLSDIGWMMGPWMIIGGLFHRATVYTYEGGIDYPDETRLWQVLAEHRITVFGISPTAIRMLMRFGDDKPARFDLSALRILGSTGEPWDDESWHWFFDRVGEKRCPIINISGGYRHHRLLLVAAADRRTQTVHPGRPWARDGRAGVE